MGGGAIIARPRLFIRGGRGSEAPVLFPPPHGEGRQAEHPVLPPLGGALSLRRRARLDRLVCHGDGPTLGTGPEFRQPGDHGGLGEGLLIHEPPAGSWVGSDLELNKVFADNRAHHITEAKEKSCSSSLHRG